MSGSSEGAYVQVADERRPCGLLELEHGKVPVDSRLAGVAPERGRHRSSASPPLVSVQQSPSSAGRSDERATRRCCRTSPVSAPRTTTAAIAMNHVRRLKTTP